MGIGGLRLRLVLWLFDIVDRMQSTFGLEVHARVMAIVLLRGSGLGFGQCTSK